MQKRHLVLSLPLAVALAVPGMAQTNQPAPSTSAPAQTQSSDTAKSNSDLQPLTLEQHEGFWGKLNPFARKKYVRKQLTPVVGRVNELDELTASNSKMIKDVDSRSQEGIRLASAKANEADSHAMDATNRANQANDTATQASNRLNNVEKTVSNIDQFAKVQDTEIRFRSGQTALSAKAKAALDQMIEPLKSQRGYVVEVQGFAPGRGQAAIASSQKMAESVVRYLVENDVPVYRIYKLGMGSAAPRSADASAKPARITSGKVEISLLRNDLSGLDSASTAPAGMNSAPGSSAPATAAPSQALPQNDQPVQDRSLQNQQNDQKNDQKNPVQAPPAPPKD